VSAVHPFIGMQIWWLVFAKNALFVAVARRIAVPIAEIFLTNLNGTFSTYIADEIRLAALPISSRNANVIASVANCTTIRPRSSTTTDRSLINRYILSAKSICRRCAQRDNARPDTHRKEAWPYS
jgi:hypothetical protein